jgi:hypothetical protein
MRPLSDIAQVVERSLEEAIYQVALTNNYTPDRDVYNTDSTYKAELEAIATANNFAVEIWGAGTSEEKQSMGVPRIVLSTGVWASGNLGSTPNGSYEDQGADFNHIRPAPMTSDFRFTMSLVSRTAAEDRILHAIMASALPHRSYVPFYNDNTVTFLVIYRYSRLEPDLREGLTKKHYIYEAIDLYEVDDDVIASGIAKINEIQVFEDRDDQTDTNIITVT